MDWRAIIMGIISSLLAGELYLWLPVLAKKLIRYHASNLPPQLSVRLVEEWDGTLSDTPGNFGKCAFAIDLFRATPRITHEYYFPDVQFRTSTEFSIRVLDILSASVGLLAFSLLWLPVALAIKLEDGGPIFSREERIGRGGKVFRRLKFRSMVFHTEKGREHLHLNEGSARVTRVGRVLRAMVLDEFPQFWNILVGHMGMVGPWPLRVAAIGRAEKGHSVSPETIPGYAERHAVRPGMAGLALVNRASVSEMGFINDAHFRYDIQYVRARSLRLNLWIIAMTIWRGLGDSKTNRKGRSFVPHLRVRRKPDG